MPESEKIFNIALQTRPPNATPEQMEQAQGALHMLSSIFPAMVIIGSFIGPWINWILVAIVYLLAAIASRGRTSFVSALALTINLFIIPAVVALINSIILALRGPEAVSGPADAVALPTLATLVHAPPKIDAALSTIGIFALWYWIVGAFGLERTLDVKRPLAIGVMVFFAVVTAGLAAWGRH